MFLRGDTQSDAACALIATNGHPAVAQPFVFDELVAVMLAEDAEQQLSFGR